MATVYLAEDLRHQRKVAVKVLRAELAAVIGAERFLAEIRTTANLQHPHILALFDSGAADSYLFYVMPYVEGETLRDRLNREKQLPIGDVVRIAKEVASALDYAHRHGVIHRDIKPENILLHDGQALVADFGIALAVSTAGSSSRMTETGMSLGTPHYMSPEQAMGEREVTARSDVYALGAICYEMLVGEPPFTGPTVQAIVAKVLTEVPRPLIPKRHTIPPHVEAVVLTALEKLAADRFGSAAEFAAALENESLSRTPLAAAAGTVRQRALQSPVVLPLAAAVVLLAAALAWFLLRPVPPAASHRYALWLPPSQAPAVNARFVISADGTRLAYSGPGPNGTQLWIKFRDRYEAVPVPGTQNALSFTFSPDGESLAFLEGTEVKRIAIAGGAAITLADSAAQTRGVAWLDSDEIVYTTNAGRSVRTVPAAGGASEQVWPADSGSRGALMPVAIPGRRAVLFGVCAGGLCGVRQELTFLDLDRRESRLIAPGIAGAAVSGTGLLVYVRRDGAMLAAPFDAGRGEMTGSAVPVLDSVMVLQGVFPLFALSQSGTLVFRPGAATGSERHELIWVDRGGRESAVDSSWQFRHAEFGGNAGWALSPDGTRLALGLATASGDDIWIKQLPRGPLSRLSFDSLPEYRPRWKPDGRSVMYIANAGAGSSSANLYERSADLTGSARLVHDADPGIYEGAWSRDGRWLAIRTGGTVSQVGGRDILAFRPGVDSAPIPLMTSAEFDESSIALSPDGRWIAYESNETGRQEVYVRPFPEVDRGKRQVSTAGGTAPLWSRDGRELFFVSGDRRMNAVQVRGEGMVELGEPEELFRLAEHVYLLPGENYTPYDVAPDGRFIMARRIRSTEVPAPLLVAEGWMSE